MNRSACVSWLCAWLLVACSAPVQPPTLRSTDGSVQRPLAPPDGAVSVVVFVSHECPIANALAPTLHDLALANRERPVQFYIVHVDPDLLPPQADAHARDYQLPGKVLLDPQHELATHLGIRRTPEAVVFAAGHVCYQGAIDDQWHAPGSRAQSASRHYLQDAIAATLSGKQVDPQRTEAVGCLLPEPRTH